MWIYRVLNIWIVLVGLLTIAYWLTRRRLSFWARRGVQYRKPHLIFGNFSDVLQKKVPMGPVLVDLYNGFKSQSFGGVWDMLRPKLFVVDPKLVGEILAKDFSTWSHRGIATNLDVNPLDDHLSNIDGKRWKVLRSKLTPTFSSSKLKHMHYLLLECGKDFEKYLDGVVAEGEPVEVTDMTAKFTTDVIGSCVFGIQMNSLSNKDTVFRKMGKKIFEPSFRNQGVWFAQCGMLRLFKFFKLSTTPQEMTDFFVGITKETFDYREKNNIQRHDFMDLLRSLKNSGESALIIQ